MSRSREATRQFPVSWEQFHLDCRALARQLKSLEPFSAIVSVARGGLVPAAIVARELSIRVVETISVASYRDENVQGTAQILKPISPEFLKTGGEHILVVDDLVDTGQTARIVRQLLPRAHYACVYAKPAGRSLVDSFITEVSQDTWIYFPWDLGLTFQNPIVPASSG